MTSLQSIDINHAIFDLGLIEVHQTLFSVTQCYSGSGADISLSRMNLDMFDINVSTLRDKKFDEAILSLDQNVMYEGFKKYETNNKVVLKVALLIKTYNCLPL